MLDVIGILTCLLVFCALVIWILFGEWDANAKQLDEVRKERDLEQHKCKRYEQEIGRLAGELSKAQNTISLMVADQANGKKVEPIKARSSAEVRKAVERRNFEEMDDDRFSRKGPVERSEAEVHGRDVGIGRKEGRAGGEDGRGAEGEG